MTEQNGYANPDALVTTQWVADHLSEGSLELVEVDEDTEAYERGHIPGAVSLHWKNELQDPVVRDFVTKDKTSGCSGATTHHMLVRAANVGRHDLENNPVFNLLS